MERHWLFNRVIGDGEVAVWLRKRSEHAIHGHIFGYSAMVKAVKLAWPSSLNLIAVFIGTLWCFPLRHAFY